MRFFVSNMNEAVGMVHVPFTYPLGVRLTDLIVIPNRGGDNKGAVPTSYAS